jgi:hypothetical protein
VCGHYLQRLHFDYLPAPVMLLAASHSHNPTKHLPKAHREDQQPPKRPSLLYEHHGIKIKLKNISWLLNFGTLAQSVRRRAPHSTAPLRANPFNDAILLPSTDQTPSLTTLGAPEPRISHTVRICDSSHHSRKARTRPIAPNSLQPRKTGSPHSMRDHPGR